MRWRRTGKRRLVPRLRDHIREELLLLQTPDKRHNIGSHGGKRCLVVADSARDVVERRAAVEKAPNRRSPLVEHALAAGVRVK